MSVWARVRESFWFLPAMLCALAVFLAEALIYLDRRIGEMSFGPVGFLINRVGESGSRDLLGAVAGSMLAVASTTFSITIAVLALSSSTYGPRLVRNFMADRGNQLVLGVFVATFLYSLLVLRSIRNLEDGGDDYFVPHLAVNLAVLLAVVAIGVLVYFIHHISDSVQVWTLARQVRGDLLDTVDRLYPETTDQQAPEVEDDEAHARAHRLARDRSPVVSEQTGYVQGVDTGRLLALADEHDLVIELQVRPGHHTMEGATLAMASPGGRMTDQRQAEIRKAVRIGQARTPQEDVEFAVLLLEEMAVRALSPSTNDPYTAVNALDDLSAGLVRLAGRPVPSEHRYDEKGQLRLVAPQVGLFDLVDHVLTAIRLYAVEHPFVLHRTLDLIDQVGAASGRDAVRARLDTQVQQLVEAFERSSPQDCDTQELTRHANEVRRSLARPVREDRLGRP